MANVFGSVPGVGGRRHVREENNGKDEEGVVGSGRGAVHFDAPAQC